MVQPELLMTATLEQIYSTGVQCHCHWSEQAQWCSLLSVLSQTLDCIAWDVHVARIFPNHHTNGSVYHIYTQIIYIYVFHSHSSQPQVHTEQGRRQGRCKRVRQGLPLLSRFTRPLPSPSLSHLPCLVSIKGWMLWEGQRSALLRTVLFIGLCFPYTLLLTTPGQVSRSVALSLELPPTQAVTITQSTIQVAYHPCAMLYSVSYPALWALKWQPLFLGKGSP